MGKGETETGRAVTGYELCREYVVVSNEEVSVIIRQKPPHARWRCAEGKEVGRRRCRIESPGWRPQSGEETAPTTFESRR